MKKRNRSRGVTLIELMLVIAILSILLSIISPHFYLLLQKATQASTKGNLGIIRSTLGLYYSDNTGAWPLAGYPDGYADGYNISLTDALTPRYIQSLPTPRLGERLGSFNGLSLNYDEQAAGWMSYSPPKDVVILRGPASPTPFLNRPWAYDPDTGLIYLCNGNYDHSGQNQFLYW